MRNQRRFSCRMACLFILSALILAAVPYRGTAEAGKVKDFSARQVIIAPDGKVEQAGELFMSDGRMRMQTFTPQSPEGMTIIVRQDKKLQWMLNTEDKTYFERPLDENEFKQLMKSHMEEQSVKELGTETVNGYECKKKEMVVTVNVMGRTMTSRSTVWMSDRFDIPLRTRNEDGTMTEMREIKEGKQPAGLFEVPGDYRKVAGMMELFPIEEEGEEAPPGQGFKIPDELKDKLPKGFKMPAIPKQ